MILLKRSSYDLLTPSLAVCVLRRLIIQNGSHLTRPNSPPTNTHTHTTHNAFVWTSSNTQSLSPLGKESKWRSIDRTKPHRKHSITTRYKTKTHTQNFRVSREFNIRTLVPQNFKHTARAFFFQFINKTTHHQIKRHDGRLRKSMVRICVYMGWSISWPHTHTHTCARKGVGFANALLEPHSKWYDLCINVGRRSSVDVFRRGGLLRPMMTAFGDCALLTSAGDDA